LKKFQKSTKKNQRAKGRKRNANWEKKKNDTKRQRPTQVFPSSRIGSLTAKGKYLTKRNPQRRSKTEENSGGSRPNTEKGKERDRYRKFKKTEGNNRGGPTETKGQDRMGPGKRVTGGGRSNSALGEQRGTEEGVQTEQIQDRGVNRSKKNEEEKKKWPFLKVAGEEQPPTQPRRRTLKKLYG